MNPAFNSILSLSTFRMDGSIVYLTLKSVISRHTKRQMVVFTFCREERVTIVRILSAGDKIDHILIKCKYFVLFHDHLYSACSNNKFANDMWIIIFFVLTPQCSSIFCKLWDHFVFTGLTTVSSVLNDLVMSTWRVLSVSKVCLILLGTWSHSYPF